MSKKKLFISWSGELSKSIAEQLKLFFEETMQHIEPFFSPDIPKGKLWLDEINKAIDESAVGILCLTPDNHDKPWVLFESGALSRVATVCPIAFKMNKENIKTPINIFQSSNFEPEEFKRLFEDINNSTGANLSQKVIDRYFKKGGTFYKARDKILSIISKSTESSQKEDEAISLLKEINRKLDKITGNETDYDLNKRYTIDLIDSVKHVLDKGEKDFIKEHYGVFQKIITSIDFVISEFSENFDMTDAINKFEDLRNKLVMFGQ